MIVSRLIYISDTVMDNSNGLICNVTRLIVLTNKANYVYINKLKTG